MSPIERQIAQAITEVVAESAPRMFGDALSKAASGADDELSAAVLEILAEVVRSEGPDAVDAASDMVIGLIKGSDSTAAFELSQYPDQLDVLVTALQNAEADGKRAAVKLAEVAGVTVRRAVGLIVNAFLARI